MSLKRSERTRETRAVYDLRQRVERAGMSFVVDEVDNIVSGHTETRLCLVREDGTRVIFPRIDEVDGIIQHYYNTFCGESGRSLEPRVSMSFEGIPRGKHLHDVEYDWREGRDSWITSRQRLL